ncbi:hypothetical protein O181_023580 [Austropuccinia psidii MF-1]|uniref:Uncharacterized protein n=1 Tax=Austropuccinia psidii MF-1 TaxID=1389203 RepID=A0A9Q3GZ81_9BASI|nr:hypothetical protein [Austropuccinia psidii MF-1]
MVSESPHPITNLETPISSCKPDHMTTDLLLNFTFFQLNCHNQYDSTMSFVTTELTHMALLLQEPWINPYNGLPPTHLNWHRYIPQTATNICNVKPRACIYINRSIPTHHIHSTPSDTNLMCCITINNLHPTIPCLTLLSVYKTPQSSMDYHTSKCGSTECPTETHQPSS